MKIGNINILLGRTTEAEAAFMKAKGLGYIGPPRSHFLLYSVNRTSLGLPQEGAAEVTRGSLNDWYRE